MIKGTDNTINVILKDQTGVVIDLNTLSGLVVIVYQKGYTMDQFSLNTQAGFRDIDVINAAGGEFNLYLNASTTKNGLIGKDVFFEIKTLAVDTEFDGGDIEKSTGELKLDVLSDSLLQNSTFI